MKYAADPDAVAEALAKRRAEDAADRILTQITDAGALKSELAWERQQVVPVSDQAWEAAFVERALLNAEKAAAADKSRDLQRRMGRFRLSLDLAWRGGDLLMLRAVFGKCVILEARYRFEFDAVEYLALSEDFQPIPEGAEAVCYRIIWENGEPRFEVG